MIGVTIFTKMVDQFVWCSVFLLNFIRYFIRNATAGESDSLVCLTGKTAIVTGGNDGIGFATSVLLASRGCKVIIACRSDATQKRDQIIEITGNKNILIKKLDLASIESVRLFAEDIKETEDKIDILINNAGVGTLKQKVTADGLNATMQTNFFGAFLLTHVLLEPLKASKEGRVIFISSGLALVELLTEENLNMLEYKQNVFSMLKLYSNSKYCGILAAQELARKVRKYNIVVNSADTGSSKTDIYKKAIQEGGDWGVKIFYRFTRLVDRDTFNAAQSCFHLASSRKLKEETGQYYFRCKRFPKPMGLKNQDFCDKIWKKCEELVQLKPEEKL